MRILQLIGDTDSSVANLAALDLHHRLAAAGREVRTLALAPRRTGGLETVVPVVAPARRSLAAAGQVRAESRWSDLVVLHGERSLTFATLPSRMPGQVPVIVALWEPLATGRSQRSSVTRVLDSARVVLAADQTAADSVRARSRVGLSVQVVPAVGDPPHPDGIAWDRVIDGVVGRAGAEGSP